eukprot:13640568-Alexandrium_andersonii.AAC.1
MLQAGSVCGPCSDRTCHSPAQSLSVLTLGQSQLCSPRKTGCKLGFEKCLASAGGHRGGD